MWIALAWRGPHGACHPFANGRACSPKDISAGLTRSRNSRIRAAQFHPGRPVLAGLLLRSPHGAETLRNHNTTPRKVAALGCIITIVGFLVCRGVVLVVL